MVEGEQAKRWAAMMAAAQAGDGDAYGRLLAELAPVIRRLAARRWRPADGLEDVVQDALLSLHQVRHTYDPARPFLPWLAAIVDHRAADAARRHYRRDANEVLVDQLPETFSPVEANSYRDDAEALRRAVASLPSGQRQAVELLKLQEMSLAEASAASGQSIGALKVAMHRALKTLKGLVER